MPAGPEFVRPPRAHRGPIHLVPLDAMWPRQYAEVAARMRQALGPVAAVVEHVGSTSVPGLAAKPFIDVLLLVPDPSAEAAYVPVGLEVVLTGLGKTAAAVATTRALARRDDLDELVVVNIGTAGALRDGLSGLHLPGSVLNHDIDAEAVRALGYDPHELLEVPGGDPVVLATGDVFVTDPLVRDRLALAAHLVDMEWYAVAFAARSFGVPVRLVKHVSDEADESAMDWPSRVEASALVLGRWLEDWLSASS